MNWDIRRVAETESTNADVAAAAREGAAEGLVVIAGHQSSGRGRLDRTWESPAGSGLAMSVLLRPDGLGPESWPWIPLAAGVAVAGGVGALGLDPQLKWPNDIELGGRKLGGILTERVETAAGPVAVVGIGINVAMTADELPIPTATSLRLAGLEVGIDDLLPHLLEALDTSFAALINDPESLAVAYAALCGTVGSTVRVSLPDGSTLEGEASEVDRFGRLVVDGQPVTAGDVVHVRT